MSWKNDTSITTCIYYYTSQQWAETFVRDLWDFCNLLKITYFSNVNLYMGLWINISSGISTSLSNLLLNSCLRQVIMVDDLLWPMATRRFHELLKVLPEYQYESFKNLKIM